MKRLFLLRHAQAEDFAGGRGDHARELTDHGREQSRAIGRELAPNGVQLILTSSALRALQTAENLGLAVPTWASDDLYNAGGHSILSEIASLPEDYSVVAVVAHAPGVPALAYSLADDDSDPDAIRAIEVRFPPATLVGLEFDGPWTELRSARVFWSRLG